MTAAGLVVGPISGNRNVSMGCGLLKAELGVILLVTLDVIGTST
jgi:hypothetical protein